ncbi:Transcriptional regulator, AbiEi antitoxin, Type IV TA system [Micrococcaceae bacterium JKS001869]|nr:Transcriptional regulator, AbiEi antitoxin, Type IV TA system [Micrococcaceae bacterium JKS001869]
MGLPPDRARRSDLERVGQCIHRQRAHPGTVWADLDLPEPGHGFSSDHLAALLRRRPDAVLSHETAAHLHGLPMPARAWRRRDPATGELEADPPVHLTVARGTRRVRRAGLLDHRRPLAPEFVTHVHGLRASGRFHGRPAAREALDSVRVGADSPPGTRLRLALVAGGLPEPELQAALEPGDPFSPVADLAYRHVRLALQDDGAGHRTREQQARDARRDRYGQARGWTTLRVTWADGREDFRGVVAVVRCRLGPSAST